MKGWQVIDGAVLACGINTAQIGVRDGHQPRFRRTAIVIKQDHIAGIPRQTGGRQATHRTFEANPRLGNLHLEILTLRDDQRDVRTVDMGFNSLCLDEPDGKDCPVFVEQATQCIQQLRSLARKSLTGSEDCSAGLLLLALW